MTTRKIYEIPTNAHTAVYEARESLKQLADERDVLIKRYIADRMAVEDAYKGPMEALLDKSERTNKALSIRMCEIVGIKYEHAHGYQIDSSYLELGHAFVVAIIPDDTVEADEKPLGQFFGEIPPKGKLN